MIWLFAVALAAPVPEVPAELKSAFELSIHQPVSERMALISKLLLGRPYTLDPLGESQLPDTDPIARYDTFDCLTFTEEVLAFSLANDFEHVSAIRKSLRYGSSSIDYENRRHFMELQWIPGVISDGWLTDITKSIGPTQHLEKKVDDKAFAAWSGRSSFSLSDEKLPTGTMSLDVLSLDTALENINKIPAGSVILTVRVDRASVPLWTTHVSLLVDDDTTDDKPPVMRHATKMGSGGTKDHSLSWYLNHLKTYKRWPVAGIAVLVPNEVGPRALP